jgi:ubiquinone/menaquinone biosynthesis C-methylase UbiE
MRGASRRPPADDVLRDLTDFHGEHAGITERTIGIATASDGRTGYDLLADRVPIEAKSVLDLGCGNGPLLAALLARRPALRRVVGVDACEAEIERARRRLPDPRIELYSARGQELGIDDASVDAVLSHHAFYLMDPVEPVIAEIARVLRPGGVFAFVTTSFSEERVEPYAEMMERFGRLTARDNPFFGGWGDRRVWSLAGLSRLFFESSRAFVAPLEVDEFSVSIEEPSAELCERLMRFFYSVQLQLPETRAELRAAWSEILGRAVTPAGVARFELPSACVAVRRDLSPFP